MNKFLKLSVLFLVAGYGLLFLSDQNGQNLFSSVSPVLIVAGYVFTGVYLYNIDNRNDKCSGREE